LELGGAEGLKLPCFCQFFVFRLSKDINCIFYYPFILYMHFYVGSTEGVVKHSVRVILDDIWILLMVLQIMKFLSVLM